MRAQRDQLERQLVKTRAKLQQAQARLQQAEIEQAQLERAVTQAQTSLQQANLQQTGITEPAAQNQKRKLLFRRVIAIAWSRVSELRCWAFVAATLPSARVVSFNNGVVRYQDRPSQFRRSINCCERPASYAVGFDKKACSRPNQWRCDYEL